MGALTSMLCVLPVLPVCAGCVLFGGTVVLPTELMPVRDCKTLHAQFPAIKAGPYWIRPASETIKVRECVCVCVSTLVRAIADTTPLAPPYSPWPCHGVLHGSCAADLLRHGD